MDYNFIISLKTKTTTNKSKIKQQISRKRS